MIALGDIKDAVRRARLSNRAVCIHSSMRSFAEEVERGPDGVLDGFLSEGCTVVVPTFSYDFEIAPPPDMRPERNGLDYSLVRDRVPTGVFTPESDVIVDSMGALPTALLARAGRVRGNHPLNSFTAIGPIAEELVAGQAPDDVYAPLEALAARDGAVLLLGVGLDSMTLLHLAEQRSGRTLFRRWARARDGRPMMVQVGGCSNGFPRLEPLLGSLATEVHVGASRWRVLPAGETLDRAASAIRDRPDVTRCDDPLCERCRDAVLGGPVL